MRSFLDKIACHERNLNYQFKTVFCRVIDLTRAVERPKLVTIIQCSNRMIITLEPLISSTYVYHKNMHIYTVVHGVYGAYNIR